MGKQIKINRLLIFSIIICLITTLIPSHAQQQEDFSFTTFLDDHEDDENDGHDDPEDGEDGVVKSHQGYILFAPEYHKNTYLIDKVGREIKVWESDYIQAMGTVLTEQGQLIRSCFRLPNPTFPFGGFTGRVEMSDWDGNLIWEYEYSNENVCLHHDIELLPNGNILMIAWENINAEEAIHAGVDPNLISGNKICPDHIIEVKPDYPAGGTIVWEWHVWDHIIQDYDSSKENYGTIKDHPELIDVNYVNSSDISHINSIDYIEEYDQILLSARHYNEIWIIDHSTTTEEAAGHTGGTYGKGGDLLYRWGNPHAYQRGSVNDQQLHFQHDARWIEPGLPGGGNILVFNNGNLRPTGSFSSVEEIDPAADENGTYFIQHDMAFEPVSPIWTYKAEDPESFFANHLSGVQRVENGNTLICDGPEGYFFEVTSENDVIWSYENTITESKINPLSDDQFTIQYYPLNYSGIGAYEYLDPEKPLTPIGEVNLSTGKKYTFSTMTTDPNGNQIAYFFDWGDGTTSGWLGPYSSGASVSATHSYRATGEYRIRVKTKDMNNFESQWSDYLNVSVNLFEVFLFGKIDSITVKESEISFWADTLVMVTLQPLTIERYPLGVYMVVDHDYSGILTNRFIAGKFYKIQ